MAPIIEGKLKWINFTVRITEGCIFALLKNFYTSYLVVFLHLIKIFESPDGNKNSFWEIAKENFMVLLFGKKALL